VTGGGSMTTHNEISKQYEKFVLEFVNAKTSDEIFSKLLDNISETFNFSPQFKEKAKRHFPTRKSFSALPKIEKQLLLLFIKKKEFWKKAEGHINLDRNGGSGRHLIDCDYKDGGSFIYKDYVRNDDDWEYSVTEGNAVKVHLSEFSEIWKEKWGYEDNITFGISRMANARHDFRRLINIEKSISRLKKLISKSKYSEIDKLARGYKTTFFASKYVRERQRNLKNILNELRKGKKLSEINGAKVLVGVYNRFCKSRLRISSTDHFYNKMVALTENHFHTSENKTDLHPYERFNSLFPTGEKHYAVYPRIGKVDISLGWLKPFRIAIIFCAVEFLRNIDTRKIERCQICREFFISKKIRSADENTFCSDKCRMAYNNRKRIESGEAKEYKRRKRMEGAKESYYG
jgi:hypothetical protein